MSDMALDNMRIPPKQRSASQVKIRKGRHMAMEFFCKMTDSKGFTLMELMIAITILAIGLMAVAGMQTTAMNANMYANRYSIATSFGQEVLEEVVSREINAPAMGFPPSADYTMFTTAPFFPGGPLFRDVSKLGRFTANFTITPNTPAANISEIRVTVIYPNNPSPYVVFGYKQIPVP